MPATGSELISRALIEIGYTAAGEVPTAAEQQDAHIIAKRMVDSMRAERLTIYDELRTAFTLTSGTRDYTIGPGGAIDIARPLWVDRAGYIFDSTATDPLEIPIDVLTPQRWAGIHLKTLDGTPLLGVYFDRKFNAAGQATVSTYPTVNAANGQLVLYTPRAATGFDALNTTYLFPPGYDEAWHFELAFQLCGPFNAPDATRARVREMRAEAWTRVKRQNVQPGELRCDPAVASPGRGTSRSQFNSGSSWSQGGWSQ